jgi:O-acetyl-ADP-ribose deacetylase (regulator of RNase III)
MNLKIYLRDHNVPLINKWKESFADCDDVDASFGDIFGIAADAIVSPANSFGFMDGGIDLAYSNYFGWNLEKKLQAVLQNEFHGELPVGMSTILKTGDKTIKYLISSPTMRIPEDVSKTLNAYLAFRATLIAVFKHNKEHSDDPITSILCPGLGTGIGRLSYGACAMQMRSAYDVIIKKTTPFPADLFEACQTHMRLLIRSQNSDI